MFPQGLAEIVKQPRPGSVPQCHPGPALTSVGDAVLLAPPPGLVDDAHPDQGRQHDAAHHRDGEDAHGGPVLPAARRGQHAQLAVRPLCAQGVGHLAGVAARVLRRHVLNHEQLVAGREVVPLREAQGAVSLEPGDAGWGAPGRFALQSHCFPHGHHAVFQGHRQGRGLCRSEMDSHHRGFRGYRSVFQTKDNPAYRGNATGAL